MSLSPNAKVSFSNSRRRTVATSRWYPVSSCAGGAAAAAVFAAQCCACWASSPHRFRGGGVATCAACDAAPDCTHLQLAQLVAHRLLGGLVQHSGIIQDVGGGRALCKQIKLSRQCRAAQRAGRQQHRCRSLQNRCRTRMVGDIEPDAPLYAQDLQSGHACEKHGLKNRQGSAEAAPLTAAALRPRACTAFCCSARHTTTLRARGTRQAAVQGATKGCCSCTARILLLRTTCAESELRNNV
jgi:hypothetical protein